MSAEDRPPGVWRRLAAFAIDGAILAAGGVALLGLVTLGIGPTVHLQFDPKGAAEVSVEGWRSLLNALLLAALSAGYFVVGWITRSGSLGQRMLGLGVEAVSPAGAALPAHRAMLRWALLGGPIGVVADAVINMPLAFLATMVIGVAWIATLLVSTARSPAGRGIHDRAAASIVIRAG